MNPREHGLLAGLPLRAALSGAAAAGKAEQPLRVGSCYPMDGTSALAAALPRACAEPPFLLGTVLHPEISACSINASCFWSHSSTGGGISFFPPVLLRRQLVSDTQSL